MAGRALIALACAALAACGPGDARVGSASAPSGLAAGPTPSIEPARPGDFGMCSGSNDKWVGFPGYPGATMLCCDTSDGLPHVFTTVFATDDPLERVKAFYTEKKDAETKLEDRQGRLALLRGPDNQSLLTVDPVGAAPKGCKPSGSNATLIVISDRPPYPR